MDPGTARALMTLPTDELDHSVVNTYQRLVGALIWLLKTRPDMQFTICLLSRFLKNATKKHLVLAMGRPLRYLKKTVDNGIVFFPGLAKWIASGASDSDLAGDLNSARSTMGHVVHLGEFGAVTASCRLERKVCTSTGQAETYAAMALVKDLVWLRGYLTELGYGMEEPTPVSVDNDGVIKQSTKMVNHTAAKHYRIAQAYIRQQVADLVVKLMQIDTNDNASDIFTKALHSPTFLRHAATIMGPQSPPTDAVVNLLSEVLSEGKCWKYSLNSLKKLIFISY